MPQVSVLMPVRNGAATLGIALRSVLKSRGVDLDVVVVDHASTDATREILSRFPVRVVEAPSTTDLAGALRIGLAHCQADVVARMDADDVMHPDRLRADLAHLVAKPDVDVVASRTKLIPRSQRGALSSYVAWQNAATSAEDHAREIWIEQPLCHPASTFRKAALDEIPWRSGAFPEDYDLFLRFVVAGKRIEKRSEVHHGWRRHGSTTTRFSRDILAELKAGALIERFDLRAKRVVIAGAGKEGGRIARALSRHGVKASAFVDVAERRIGRKRHGVDVLDARALASLRGAFLVGAVGTSGTRGVVRASFADAGFVEGVDAVVVA
jgi:glycosyltransferase involved in cell wall biosynthesis